jgi:hypothetical protein
MHTQAENIIKELYLGYGTDIKIAYNEFGENKTLDETSWVIHVPGLLKNKMDDAIFHTEWEKHPVNKIAMMNIIVIILINNFYFFENKGCTENGVYFRETVHTAPLFRELRQANQVLWDTA